jgi:pimeloyl-ACP methyl ester carboxylesterase
MTGPTSSRAAAWRAEGAHFSWSPSRERAAEVQVFHIERGDEDAPALALVHGFPTCSIDWFEAAELEYPSRAKFLEMASDPGYLAVHEHRAAALADSRLIACRSMTAAEA